MKLETMAIHSGYEPDSTTKSVAVPIYQTVAYAFDSADHAAALFNLEAEGFRYTRIQNPTTAVLERRVAALEGGVEALCTSSGQAAVNFAVLNVTEMGSNLTTRPAAFFARASGIPREIFATSSGWPALRTSTECRSSWITR